ncbi:MAG: aminotransferase class I/II-fold pyridoxal phosphate-dependent enzyme, partial [Candidatus Faecousia sp.]|nr:aminotransferase class I/II-fold pyridoxal phosphate-dependent enzyme [Candidatus Faecousia sp.]
MKYDFTTVMDRRGMDAIAVEQPPQMPSKPGFDLIPMWVADMNFATVPTVVDAMIRRARHPAFGYFSLRQEYYDGILRWHKRHHNVDLKPEYISYANGVLGGVVSALNVLCSKGDNVLVHSPTYVGFTHALGDNGYNIVHSPLRQDAEGVWRMDYADMEEKILQNKIHAAILCSPHNPCGRVWERWELERAMELFQKHDVYVIS